MTKDAKLAQRLLALTDMRELGDKILESEKGLRLKLADSAAATYTRHKFYKFRALDREQTAEIYPPGDPMHGFSAYDAITVVKDDNVLTFRKADVNAYEVEEL